MLFEILQDVQATAEKLLMGQLAHRQRIKLAPWEQ
jgi:hypothetical protein